MNHYIGGVKMNGWKQFNKRLWQRNYYERIIRNENELYKIRQYINNNPSEWDLDKENPENWIGYNRRMIKEGKGRSIRGRYVVIEKYCVSRMLRPYVKIHAGKSGHEIHLRGGSIY